MKSILFTPLFAKTKAPASIHPPSSSFLFIEHVKPQFVVAVPHTYTDLGAINEMNFKI
jgi:hypothetical protein